MARVAATVASLLDDAATRIGATLGLDTREARLEARVLAAFAWGVAPAWLIARGAGLPGRARRARGRARRARGGGGGPSAGRAGAREGGGRSGRGAPDGL